MAIGCAGDLEPYRVPREAVAHIEPLDLPVSPSTRPASEFDPTSRPATRPAVEPVPLTLGEARALALENNADLAITRLGPRIAQADLAAEEAAFEAIFTVDANFANLDSPIVNQTVLIADGDGDGGDPTDPTDPTDPGAGGEPRVIRVVGGQTQTTVVNPALVKPLRSGGSVGLELPFDRLETDDEGRILNPQYEQDARFTFTQPLGRGYGADATEQAIRIAVARLGQALVRQKLEVINVLAAVDRAYWTLYRARQAEEVREQQVELAEEQLARARRLFAAGGAPQVEVVRAESGLADALELLITARADVGTQERQLKVLLNAGNALDVGDPSDLIPETQPVPVLYELDPDQLLNAALARRMELLEAELLIAEQRANVLAARNAQLPVLDLRYEYGVNGLGGDYGDAVDVLGDVDFEDHTLGLFFEMPLGNRALRERLRAANLRRLEQLADREARILLVRREVYDAIADLRSAWARVGAAQRRVIAAQRLLEAEIRQFELGTRTSTEVLEAQTNLATARLSLIQALTDYEIARTNLAVATGTVLGKTGVILDVPE